MKLREYLKLLEQHKKEVKEMMFLLKPSWWIQMLVSTFVTMMFIYLIKKITKAVNIPVVSNVVEEV